MMKLNKFFLLTAFGFSFAQSAQANDVKVEIPEVNMEMPAADVPEVDEPKEEKKEEKKGHKKKAKVKKNKRGAKRAKRGRNNKCARHHHAQGNQITDELNAKGLVAAPAEAPVADPVKQNEMPQVAPVEGEETVIG